MGESAIEQPPEPPRDVFGLLRYAAGAVDANTAATEVTLEAARRVEAVVRQALDRPAAPGLTAALQSAVTAQILCTGRLADQGQAIRELPAAMRDMALVEASATAPLAEVVPEARPRRARHAAGRRGLRAVPGVQALLPAGLIAVLRHSWAAAHPVAAGAVATGAVVVATSAAIVSGAPVPLPFGGDPASPAAGRVGCCCPVRHLPPVVAAVSPGGEAESGRGPVRPLGWMPAPRPVPAGTDPGPSPSQQQAGVLTADVTGVNLGVLHAGTLTVRASGGPVTWAAVRGSRSITLGSARGRLGAGESATIGVTVTAAAEVLGGSATVRVWGGSGPAVEVTVTWDPLPAVVPSLAPSVDVSLPPVLGG